MIKEIKDKNSYCVYENNTIICEITKLTDDTYYFQTRDTIMVLKVKVIDDYYTSIQTLRHETKTKNGYYRKSTKLLQHNQKWGLYMLEEKGFIRKPKCI